MMVGFGVRRAWRLIRKRRKAVKVQERQLRGARRRLEAANQRLDRARQRKREASKWGGCREITNEIIAIVDGRAAVSSRKRAADHPLSVANPGSDHNAANGEADAVDFAIADAFALRDEISRKLGGPSTVSDFATFEVKRHGVRFRLQAIAGTHGTGPHMHWGVRRIG